MFDESLNRAAINILLCAPILYCTFGFWMFNNKQMFHNQVLYNERFGDHYKFGHNILSIFDNGIDQSFPLLVLLFIIIGLYSSRHFWYKRARRYLGLDKIGSLKTEEMSFYEALSHKQRRMLVNEEVSNRKKLKFMKINNKTLDKLKDPKLARRDVTCGTHLIGAMTYQILDNPMYQTEFQFVPGHVKDRDEFSVVAVGQSDFVKKTINQFYIEKAEIEEEPLKK
jgi:hypothetical protein